VFIVIVVGVAIVPWIAAAVLGLASRSDEAILLAAPSPFYAFMLLGRRGDSVWLAGLAASIGWAALGLGLLAAGRKKARQIIRAYDDHFARAEAALAAEEAAAAAPGVAVANGDAAVVEAEA